jgi:phosphatidylserine/phosphatidylglycerophosphate/cardiolipin synthase-like enzyme
MHKKILVVDHEQIFTGSANLTETSLRLHDNLILGCYDTGLAHFLESSLDSFYCLHIDNQKIEFWSLPEQEQKALTRLLEEIDKAKKSIMVCMFTFTHQKIYQSLLDAKNRGVDISIAIDYYSSRGASKNIMSNLYKQGITPYIGAPGKLLHNKWCLIDEDTLILGSTNWTHSAFTKNDDSLILLPRLSPKIANYIKKIWKETEYTSTVYKENAIN